MIDLSYIQTLEGALRARGVPLAPGLSEAECRAIEEDFGFVFPPDLRSLLTSFVPAGEDFPDWHQPHGQDLLEWLDAPGDGIAFDVEEGGFWPEQWGDRPDDRDDAVEEALRLVALAPRLIPVHGPHYLPCEPSREGNPVLLIMQTEVSVAGEDLGWFLSDALALPEPPWPRPVPRRVTFWTELGGGG